MPFSMTPNQASIELRKMVPIARMKSVPPAVWAEREPLIRIVEASRQNLAYIKDRDALIPAAERYADAITTVSHEDPSYNAVWTRNFHARMNKLMER